MKSVHTHTGAANTSLRWSLVARVGLGTSYAAFIAIVTAILLGDAIGAKQKLMLRLATKHRKGKRTVFLNFTAGADDSDED